MPIIILILLIVLIIANLSVLDNLPLSTSSDQDCFVEFDSYLEEERKKKLLINNLLENNMPKVEAFKKQVLEGNGDLSNYQVAELIIWLEYSTKNIKIE